MLANLGVCFGGFQRKIPDMGQFLCESPHVTFHFFFQNDLREGSNEEDEAEDLAEAENDFLEGELVAPNGPQIQLHITSDSQDEDNQHIHVITSGNSRNARAASPSSNATSANPRAKTNEVEESLV